MKSNKCKIVVLASGAGTNFRALADACSKKNFPAEIAGLISDNPEAGALDIAREKGIEHFCVAVKEDKGRLPPEAETRIKEISSDLGAGLIALAGFMRILKGPLLEHYQDRIMNIHPALLPSFKGLHAQKRALDYGVKIAGCTVHFVDGSIDGGAIIIQASVPVKDEDDEESLSRKILEQEHRAYAEAVRLFSLGLLEREGRIVRILAE